MVKKDTMVQKTANLPDINKSRRFNNCLCEEGIGCDAYRSQANFISKRI